LPLPAPDGVACPAEAGGELTDVVRLEHPSLGVREGHRRPALTGWRCRDREGPGESSGAAVRPRRGCRCHDPEGRRGVDQHLGERTPPTPDKRRRGSVEGSGVETPRRDAHPSVMMGPSRPRRRAGLLLLSPRGWLPAPARPATGVDEGGRVAGSAWDHPAATSGDHPRSCRARASLPIAPTRVAADGGQHAHFRTFSWPGDGLDGPLWGWSAFQSLLPRGGPWRCGG
jgi:hypothetical protein